MIVLIIDHVHESLMNLLGKAGFTCWYEPEITREQILGKIGHCSGLVVRSKTPVDREIIDQGTQLKFIARAGSGLENIDTGYALSKNIACLNSPEGNRHSVGEHAVGLLLGLLNYIPRSFQQLQNGIWARNENRGNELRKKTIGIIGYGNTGSAFAQKLSGFEINVLSYDKYKTGYQDRFTHESGMEEVFENADILSLHVPLTAETRHMINHSYLQQFKKDIWLINTSRGEVVLTDDLVINLQSGKVKGAALDVLEYEKNTFESIASRQVPPSLEYLLHSDKVILTPHIAGWTHESYIQMSEILASKIIRLIKP
jgi:D-3-phosphoglycerate dehydrogenase / 2-oxoglutarate reductase